MYRELKVKQERKVIRQEKRKMKRKKQTKRQREKVQKASFTTILLHHISR